MGIRKFVTASLLAIGITLGGTVAQASADPVVGAGCAAGTVHQNWGNSTYPPYEYEINFSWCWSTGGSTSQIHDIRGTGVAEATTIFTVESATGPQTSNQINILPADYFGNATYIYGFFRSRDCLTGDLGLICSGWTLHRTEILITSGGGFAVVSQS